MRKGKIWIGTSGWHYDHWIGTFYPAGTKASEQFRLYAKQFSTVEVNNSFYRLPSPEVFAAWKKAAPRGFLFAVKASRFITHMKKLKGGPETSERFFTHIEALGNKLGPLLFQLPPLWKVNVERLKDFLSHIPKGHRYVFEFRNPTWYTEEVYALLREHNCAFCLYELAQHMSPAEITADFVYLRLHGPGEQKYQGSYTRATLKTWARKCRQWSAEGRDVYVYFDNDQSGYAAFNALSLQEMVKQL